MYLRDLFAVENATAAVSSMDAEYCVG